MMNIAARVSRPTYFIARRSLSACDEVKTLLYELERSSDTSLIIKQAIDTKLHRRFCDEESKMIKAIEIRNDLFTENKEVKAKFTEQANIHNSFRFKTWMITAGVFGFMLACYMDNTKLKVHVKSEK